MPSPESQSPVLPRIFANRTLNLRSIKAVGFDMDYTLVYYVAWEECAYHRARDRLAARNWPVADLRPELDRVMQGLVVDLELGNVVKPNRFGYVTRAYHGTRRLDFAEQRQLYSRRLVDLHDPRWVFAHTLFSLSETLLYCQLVDLLDLGRLGSAIGYRDLYALVRESVDAVHLEGALKAEVMSHPERFVELDPDLPLSLLDLKHAGKQLWLITNSEWAYTRALMSYAFDRFLPASTSWRSLFDLVIVGARKPEFFRASEPWFEVVEETGLLRPFPGRLEPGRAFLGGCAARLEHDFGLAGEEILYVGDHVYSDVQVCKQERGWRTALVMRELEQELAELAAFAEEQHQLDRLMARKAELEEQAARARLELQRLEAGYGPPPSRSREELRRSCHTLRSELEALDQEIAPLGRRASELGNRYWGLLLRAGNDKSLLARQIEHGADIYMSRVSHLLHHTPFAYLRAPRSSLPHDP